MGSLISICDYFVIASGATDRQLRAMAEEVERALAASGVKPLRREGERELRWLLLDYGDIVVHLFVAEARRYYELERLWSDAAVVDWEASPERAQPQR